MKIDFSQSYELVEQYANEAQYGVVSAYTTTVRDIHSTTNPPSSGLIVDQQSLATWKATVPTTNIQVTNLTPAILTTHEPVYYGTTGSILPDRLLKFRSTVISGIMAPKANSDSTVISLSSSINTLPAPVTDLTNLNLNGGMFYEATRIRATDFSYDGSGYAINGIPVFKCAQPGAVVQKVVIRQTQPFTFSVTTDPQCVSLSANDGIFTELGIGYGYDITSSSNAAKSITGYVAPFNSIYSPSGVLLDINYGPMLSSNCSDYFSRSVLSANTPAVYSIATLTNTENGEIGNAPVSDATRATFNRVYVETDSGGDPNSIAPRAFADKGYHNVGNGRDFVAKLSYENDLLKYGITKDSAAGIIYKISMKIFWDTDLPNFEIFTTKDAATTPRDGDLYLNFVNDGIKDYLGNWQVTAPLENPTAGSFVYNPREWLQLDLTNETLSGDQTFFLVKINNANIGLVANQTSGAMQTGANLFNKIVVKQKAGTPTLNRVYVDDVRVFFKPKITTFNLNSSYGSELAPRIETISPRLYNLNSTYDNQGILDVFFFYDDFDMESKRGAKANYFGGIHDEQTLSLVSKYTYDTGTSSFNRSNLLFQRSQGDCFAFADEAWLIHGSSHSVANRYHPMYGQLIEVYDCMIDTSAIFNGAIIPSMGNSFRNASANTEWFALSYFGFFCYDDPSVANPMNACYYIEDSGYPKGGASFTSRVTFKMNKASTTMFTTFGSYPDAYMGYFAGSCMSVLQPSNKAAYLFGGRTPSNGASVSSTDFTQDIRVVDLVTDTPTSLTTANMMRRVEGSVASCERDNIWVVGGVGSYNNSDTKKYGTPLNLVWKFDSTNETIAVLAAKLPLGRGFGVATTNMSHTKMHVAGGGDLNYNNWFDSESISIIDFSTGTECVRCESTLGINRVGHMGASI